MLKIKALKKSVVSNGDQLAILKGIDLEIKAGEAVAIVGSSGSGKSTLLGLMAGLDDVSAGSIVLQGEDIAQMDEEQRALWRARWVGFVFQSFQLLPSLTALENVMLPLELHKNPQAKSLALEYLHKVGLEHRLQHLPKHLSGGEQQRVAIARAFASQPKILFADEPTGNLDNKTGAVIVDLLFDLNRTLNTTLVLVTHDEKLANRCDRCLWMSDGRLWDHSPENAVESHRGTA